MLGSSLLISGALGDLALFLTAPFFSGALGALGPLAVMGGIAFLGNKFRKQLTGYDTQAAYETAREERIANKRLDRITDRIVGGKNFGNYEKALLDSGAGAVKIDDVVMHGADYFPGPPKAKTYRDQPNIHDDNDSTDSTGSTGSTGGGASYGNSGKTGAKDGFGYGLKYGGIASL